MAEAASWLLHKLDYRSASLPAHLLFSNTAGDGTLPRWTLKHSLSKTLLFVIFPGGVSFSHLFCEEKA